MNLPEAFIKNYSKKVKGSSIFGIELEELTKEELLVVAAAGWCNYDELLKERNSREVFPSYLETLG